MKKVIDEMTSVTGWAGSSTKAIIHGVNQIPEYCAGWNTSSLIFKFLAGGNGSYVQKTITNDLSSYDEVIFHVWSRSKSPAGLSYNLSTDYAYKIDFGGVGYYIPLGDGFQPVTIAIPSTGASRIRITCLHDTEDYLILSHMVAVRDEFPVDIFRGIKEALEYERDFQYSKASAGVLNKGLLIASGLNLVAGARSVIMPSSLSWVDKYATIRIDDGAYSELHQIDKSDEQEYIFLSTFDGLVVTRNYSNCSLYLTMPIEFSPSETEIYLPGMAIWGMNPEEIFQSSKIDEIRDSFTDAETVQSRTTHQLFRYPILIDCEARHDELIGVMSKIVRVVLAREYLWVNGKKVRIFNTGTSNYLDALEGYNEIPKIQYTAYVDIREEVYNRETRVKTTVNNLSVEVQ